MNSPRSMSLKRPELIFNHSKLGHKLHISRQFQAKIQPKSTHISLKFKKVKSKTQANQIPGFTLLKGLDFNISNENILKTPSTINENPPLSIDFLNESLSNYYESEVNRFDFNKSSITPVPSAPIKQTQEKSKRSMTPSLVFLDDNKHSRLPDVSRAKKKSFDLRNLSTLQREKPSKPTLRYFSRRERKVKSPESKKFVYYFFK